ncbi:multidrug efflux SMR transporter [Micromonospora peucetia]|uniref:Multidrug efflux SMR transporter n=1 Tax=Micromonospora peucetia TaxID=47871 RepID=A0A1C6W301_9ACTN|nr:multidrug efflux SMR transporter [Micromonospora peucetia]MCX4391199.1 multidrug efflux SMR transporter [Micromonospora peucetia]WSA32111.1 multidrug efflux SMR transporter [Micromonospora peucetia]SCL72784.1 small multidrug resistance pump [Micromonospora peucetia]
MSWVFLAAAIAFEITATMALRASEGLRNKAWAPVVVGGYVTCFVFLSLALRNGMAVGVAYGIWAAAGIALTAIIARLVFRDPLTKVMMLGIGLIAAGVLLVELGAQTAH